MSCNRRKRWKEPTARGLLQNVPVRVEHEDVDHGLSASLQLSRPQMRGITHTGDSLLAVFKVLTISRNR